MAEFRPVAAARRQGTAGARPVQGAGMPYNPPHCTAATKAGVPCKAPRAFGTLLCVGHLKQQGELRG